jgi:nitronate monooxygenase
MGSVSTPDLAIAVAEAGGVGTITALGLSAERLDSILADMARRTSGVLAVNFLTEQLDRDAVAAAATRVKIVDFFWVDPDPSLVDVVHGKGALACWQVGSPDEGRAALDAGCDIVVAQGVEAGGHIRGHSPLRPLLDSLVDELDVPVLAAGGISDQAAFADVLRHGAAGARVGTRFVATDESGAHPIYKQAVLDARAGETEITDAFAVCPLCATSPRARVLRPCVNAVRRLRSEEVGEVVLGGQRLTLPKGHGLPPGTTATGNIDAMPMYAGESVGTIESIESAADVIESWAATR